MPIVVVVAARGRRIVPAEVLEAAAASDASNWYFPQLGAITEATATASDSVNAFLGQYLREAASAADATNATLSTVFSRGVVEAVNAIDTVGGVIPHSVPASLSEAASAADALNASVTAPSASYGNPGGTGNRTSIITVTTTATSVVGSVSNIVNGNFSADGTGGYFWSSESGRELRFDFGSSKLITEAKWYQNSVGSHGDWKWQGSADTSTWTDIGGSFTLGTATPVQTITTLSGNSTYYRYYRLQQVSGTLNVGPWIQEIEFKISA